MAWNPIDVAVRKLPHFAGLELPSHATPDAAGADLRAALPEKEELVIPPGQVALVPTGLAFAIPPGYEGQVRARSGLAFRHRIAVLNGPGTIDADYRGEVQVILMNFGDEPFRIHRGDRIAQFVLARVERPTWKPVDELPPDATTRGAGGFGSTGRG